MNEELKQKLIARLLAKLQSQSFADWYGDGGRFDTWLRGELTAPTDEVIKQDIERMFLKDL